jgi:hypothetical protein
VEARGAAVAAAEATASRPTWPRSATAATRTAILGEVDADLPAVEFGSGHRFHGCTGLVFALEPDETEAAAAAGLAVEDETRFGDLTEAFEGRTQAVVARGERKAADEELVRHLDTRNGDAPRAESVPPESGVPADFVDDGSEPRRAAQSGVVADSRKPR